MDRILQILSVAAIFAIPGCCANRLTSTEWAAQQQRMVVLTRDLYSKVCATPGSPDRIVFVGTNTLGLPRLPWNALVTKGKLSQEGLAPGEYIVLIDREAIEDKGMVFELDYRADRGVRCSEFALLWSERAQNWTVIASWEPAAPTH